MKYENENEIIKVVRSFENGTISRDAWKHREHLTVALYYIENSSSLIEASDKMRAGIFNLLKCFGVDLEKEMPYHETMTRFWMNAVNDLAKGRNGYSIVEMTNLIVEKLGDKDLPLKFYSCELLFSEQARKDFIAPDLRGDFFGMKLIFIYGAPAVGKLTVADEVACQTDFKVFHNHLSIDCIEPIFPFGTNSFWKLIDLIRTETITEAARAGQNLIHTFCYAKGSDDEYVAKITQIVEENGGEICFVLLTCEKAELEKRVLEESRRQFGKANNLELLREILDKYDLFSPVPERESLQIDNTNLSVSATAQKIIEHYKLEISSQENRQPQNKKERA